MLTISDSTTVKFHVEGLELIYNFIRGSGWAYKRGEGAYISGGAHISGNKKMLKNDEMKRI